MSFIKKILPAAAALMLVSCGSVSSDKAEFTKKTDTEVNAVLSSAAETEAPVTTVPEETTVTTTTAETTTTTTTAKPVKLKTSVTENHSFNIENFSGKVYSNKKLQKAFDEIDDICSRYGSTLSFVYKNMDTGAICGFNEYASKPTCSTIKAPFCKELLERGIDLDEEITVNVIWDRDYGEVASMGYGTKLTARELIRYAIRQSDNTAYYNLVNYYGWNGFNQMNNSLGSNYYLGNGWIFTYCNVYDLLYQYEDIYKYAEKSKRGEWLIELMTKTDYEGQITAQLAKKYKVAHKYGSDSETYSFHDCAIVYADSPFVLIIMTDQMPETKESCKVFKQLAKQFDIVNSQLVVED